MPASRSRDAAARRCSAPSAASSGSSRSGCASRRARAPRARASCTTGAATMRAWSGGDQAALARLLHATAVATQHRNRRGSGCRSSRLRDASDCAPATAHQRQRRSGGRAAAPAASSTARRPGALSSRRIEPPCRRATAATRLRPRPLPGCERLFSRRTKRCSARSRSCGGDAGPAIGDGDLDRCRRRGPCDDGDRCGRASPSAARRAASAEYLMALSTRLATAWLTSSRLATHAQALLGATSPARARPPRPPARTARPRRR